MHSGCAWIHVCGVPGMLVNSPLLSFHSYQLLLSRLQCEKSCSLLVSPISRIGEQTCKLHGAAEISSFDLTSKNPLHFSCDTEYKLTQTLGVPRATD